jgi:hypothetical protein
MDADFADRLAVVLLTLVFVGKRPFKSEFVEI